MQFTAKNKISDGKIIFHDYNLKMALTKIG